MDLFISNCKTGERELTQIAVPRGTPGMEIEAINRRIALNGVSTVNIVFKDCRVPVANTIGEIGNGLKNTLVVLERGRCHVAAWGYSLGRRSR